MNALAGELHLVDADAPPATREVEDRILDAALALVGRWGVSKSALADVAKEAGCSRATLYRAFPGGKDHLFRALGVRELEIYLAAITDAIDSGDALDEALTRALVVAARLLRDHDAAQFLLEHEPGIFLPFLGFNQVDRIYALTVSAVGPHLERFVPAQRAQWAAEWAARIFLSYLFNPHADLDLVDVNHARSLVDRYLMPAFVGTTVPLVTQQT